MSNIFYTYGIIWTNILFLYWLGWSDLCEDLNFSLLSFLLFLIISSFVMGYLLKDKLKFIKLNDNTYSTNKITYALLVLYVCSFLYSGYVPLFEVLKGESYLNLPEFGIPHIHLLTVSFSLFYTFHLSYMFVCFKEKKTLLVLFMIILYFILLVQRQNVFFSLFFFFNTFLANLLEKSNFKYKFINTVIILLIILLVFYCMGIMGNLRYGNMWEWDDSSMIMILGQANSDFPSIIPSAFFWTYLYLVSPLTNLNYNINSFYPDYDIYSYILEYVPRFVSKRFDDYTPIDLPLLVDSLNVSTGYARNYLHGGIFGMILNFIFSACIIYIIIRLSYKYKSKFTYTNITALNYFLLLNFFSNTFTYSITWFMIFYSFIFSILAKISFSYKGGSLP